MRRRDGTGKRIVAVVPEVGNRIADISGIVTATHTSRVIGDGIEIVERKSVALGAGNEFSQIKSINREINKSVDTFAPLAVVNETLEMNNEKFRKGEDRKLFGSLAEISARRTIPHVLLTQSFSRRKKFDTRAELDGFGVGVS